MATLEIGIISGPGGAITKKSKKEKDTADYFYDLGRASAALDRKSQDAESSMRVADIYSSAVYANSKMLMDKVLTDLASLAAELKIQTLINQRMLEFILGQRLNPPPLSPLLPIGGRQASPGPLPIGGLPMPSPIGPAQPPPFGIGGGPPGQMGPSPLEAATGGEGLGQMPNNQ